MFIAAAASDITLRDGLISRLHVYASSNLDNQPFEVVYNPTSGHQITGAARSVTLHMYIPERPKGGGHLAAMNCVGELQRVLHQCCGILVKLLSAFFGHPPL